MGLFGKKKQDYDWFSEGNECFDADQYLDAIHCYQKVGDKSVRLMLDTYRNMGLCWQHLEQYETAVSCFNFVLKIDPDEYQSLIYRTKLLEKTGPIKEFNESMSQLIALRKKVFPEEDFNEWYKNIEKKK